MAVLFRAGDRNVSGTTPCTDHRHTILSPAAKRYQMLVDDEDDATDALVTTLTREEQQTENKSWQDVMDVPTKRKAETSGILEQMRECHDTPAARADGAEKLKAEANEAFGRGEYGLAMRSYLTGLWLLRLDDPPLPKVLTEPEAPSGPPLMRMLESDSAVPLPAPAPMPTTSAVAAADAPASASEPQPPEEIAGNDGEDDGSATEAEAKLVAVRKTLHLNVAAAAIKMAEWGAARVACKHVLGVEPANAKALYRLAQAHEGLGDLTVALGVLQHQLLTEHPGHKEGARLAATLKARAAKERKMFGGLFERAQGDGGDDDGLYSANALAAEAARRKKDKDDLMKLENVAKLPPDMWAETMKDLEEPMKEKLRTENRELASQMPDDAWQKYAANMTPEAIQEAKDAVEIHKMQEALKAEGVLEPEDLGEEADEDTAYEMWLDGLVTKFAGVMAIVVALFAVLVSLRPGALVWLSGSSVTS